MNHLRLNIPSQHVFVEASTSGPTADEYMAVSESPADKPTDKTGK